MPRHATQDFVRALLGQAGTGTGRLATETWVAGLVGATGATVGRVATEDYARFLTVGGGESTTVGWPAFYTATY